MIENSRTDTKLNILICYVRVITMLANLSLLLEEFSVRLEETWDYLVKQYDYDDMLILILNPEDEGKLNILSKEAEKIKKDFGLMFDTDVTIGESVNVVMDRLQKLIDELKANEEEFYKEVLNSGNPNFLITTYYSLYLRFITTVYSKLTRVNTKTKDSRIKDILYVAYFLIGFLGMPILLYTKKKEVSPYISELSGALLHVLVADMAPMPSKDSLGYYLFFKIHGDE